MKHEPGLPSSLKGYVYTFGIFWLMGSIALLLWGYKGSFLVFNRLHFPLGDELMPHFTHLGEGAILPSLLGLWLLRRNTAMVFTILVSMVGVTVVIALAKNYLFPEFYRPLAVFQDSSEAIHYVALRRWTLYAFPSGHSAAAAASFMFFAFFTGSLRPWTSWLWGLLAVAICYSRLYVGVHFLGDILAGSLLGVLIALGGLLGFYPLFQRWLGSQAPGKARIIRSLLFVLAVLAFIGGLYTLLTTYYLDGTA